MRKTSASARVALITVLSGLGLALVSFVPVHAGHGGDHGNKNAGCNQNKPTPTHRYDANCDGSASENGNSDASENGNGNSDATPNGKANGHETASGSENGGGKPCAGCVGKADNKHPPGQEPDENDHNKGYECDDNHGVGAQRGTGNPAHTGCRPPRASTPGPSPTTPVNPSTPPSPKPSKTPKIKPTVKPTVIHRCDANENVPGIQSCADVEGDEAAQRERGSALPFTGGDVAAVLVVGVALIAGGGTMMVRRRR